MRILYDIYEALIEDRRGLYMLLYIYFHKRGLALGLLIGSAELASGCKELQRLHLVLRGNGHFGWLESTLRGRNLYIKGGVGGV